MKGKKIFWFKGKKEEEAYEELNIRIIDTHSIFKKHKIK